MSNPSNYPVPPLQLRRGQISSVTNYVAAVGELIYATDTKRVFIGDGLTSGGNPIVGSYNGGNLDFGSILQPAGFTLDLGSII
jgi:hypothetical protein